MLSRQRRFDSLEQEAFLNLWRTYDRMKALEDALFAEFELSAQQYNALRLLRWARPESMQTLDLASRLVSRAPDITRLLDKLEQRRLVRRQRRAENRRVVEVAISKSGLDLLSKLDRLVRDCHQRQLGHLSPDQLRTLIDLLKVARRPHEEAASQWFID